MNAIQKLVESILVKMGFVGAVVENIYLDSKPFRHIRFVADIPVISFLPHLVKYLKGADHLYCGNDDLHPLFIYFSEAATLKAGPVNLANFRFEVSIASTHLRLVSEQPDLLIKGFNRDNLEYVYYRSDLAYKDLILGLVEHGSPFIKHLHGLIQKRILNEFSLIFFVLEKILESAKPQILACFHSVDYEMNVKIIAEAIPETVSNQIVTSDYIVNSISDADKFINHVRRYLAGRVMKRRIYAELDVCEETSNISLVNLGCFTSPLLVTEYQMFKPHSSGLYRKAINNSLKQFKPEMHVPSEELFYN
ncbi:hypothetical protein AC866_21095 [Salmonella enterica subsp. enterica serovar Kentucky]|nr:hypothetical protein [Salmonella enterica subsp. enterica serovar Kentucky]